MASTISTKLSVEGVQTFRRSFNDATKNVKDLDKELKLAAKQFATTGDKQTYMAQRGKLLREEIANQENAVETCINALEDFRKKGLEDNSREVMEFRGRLAQARSQLSDMRTALENNERGLDENGNAYEATGEKAQNFAADVRTASSDTSMLQSTLSTLGVGVGLDGLHDAISGITGALESGIRKAAQLGKAIWDAGVEATVWADDLLTLSDQTGLSPETLQRWEYASRFVDVSVDSFIANRKKLLNSMDSSSEDTALAFNRIGVETHNLDGSLRNVDDVMWETLERLGAIENETTRDAYAMEIFGKSFDQLNPLIKAGRDTWDAYAEAAPIISDDKVRDLGDANDAIEDMNAQLEALKLDILADVAPLFTQIATAISTVAQEVREYLDTEEGQAAIDGLITSISDLLTSVTEADIATVVQNIGSWITKIVEGFTQLVNKKDEIETAIKAFGVAFAGLKLMETASALLKIFNSFNLLRGAAGAASGAAGGAASGAAGAAASGAAGAATKTSAIAALKAGAGTALWTAGPAALMAGMVYGIDRYNASQWTQQLADWTAELNDFRAAAEGIDDGRVRAAVDLLSDFAGAREGSKGYGSDMSAINDTFLRGLADSDAWSLLSKDTRDQVTAYVAGALDIDQNEVWALAERAQREVMGAVEGAMPNGVFDPELLPTGTEGASFLDIFDAWADGTDEWNDITQRLVDAGIGIGGDYAAGAAEGIASGTADVASAAEDIGAAMAEATAAKIDSHSPSKVAEALGASWDAGMARGINANASVVIAAAARVAAQVAAITRNILDIHSPSGVGEELGAYFGEGFALGIGDASGMVAAGVSRMMGGIAFQPRDVAQSAPAMQAASYEGLADTLATALSMVRVQIDGEDAGRLIAPTVEDIMAAKMESRRYA